MTEPDGRIDRLFTLPPEEFTAARDDLAKRLKADGDADAAKQVKALRKPTVAAWAVNQVVRAEPEAMQALSDSAAALRLAQRKAMSGVRTGFREATSERLRAVDRLVEAAKRLLEDAGRPPAGPLESIRATFEAASLDEEAAEEISRARLSKELPPPSGFGMTGGLAIVPDQEEEEAELETTAPPPRRNKRLEDLRARRDAATKELGRRSQDAATARREAVKAGRVAERAGDEADRAERQAADKRKTAEKAATAAQRAERNAEGARAAAAEAEGALEAVEAELELAEKATQA